MQPFVLPHLWNALLVLEYLRTIEVCSTDFFGCDREGAQLLH